MPVLANQDLLLRFAQWMVAQAPSHAASNLVSAVLSKSPIIGRRVQHAWNSASDQDLLRERLQSDFSPEQIRSIFTILGAQSGEVTWSSSADRQRQRQGQLDAIAQSLGFETWRRFETAAINGDIEIRVEDPSDPDVIAEKHRADMEALADGSSDQWDGADE